MLRVLFIDDEPDNREAFRTCCEDFWEVKTVSSTLPVMRSEVPIDDFDVAIVDLVFNFVDGEPPPPSTEPDPREGLEFLGWATRRPKLVPLIVVSAWLDLGTIQMLKQRYPEVTFLEKPITFSSDEFRKTVETRASSSS